MAWWLLMNFPWYGCGNNHHLELIFTPVCFGIDSQRLIFTACQKQEIFECLSRINHKNIHLLLLISLNGQLKLHFMMICFKLISRCLAKGQPKLLLHSAGLSTQFCNSIPVGLWGTAVSLLWDGKSVYGPVWRLEDYSVPSWDVKDLKYDMTSCLWWQRNMMMRNFKTYSWL